MKGRTFNLFNCVQLPQDVLSRTAILVEDQSRFLVSNGRKNSPNKRNFREQVAINWLENAEIENDGRRNWIALWIRRPRFSRPAKLSITSRLSSLRISQSEKREIYIDTLWVSHFYLEKNIKETHKGTRPSLISDLSNDQF